MMRKIQAVLPLVFGLSLVVTACDSGAEKTAADQTKKEKLPKIKVELPSPPNFDEGKAPEKWEDGSYSIYGLRSNIDDRAKEGDAQTEILVKGYVQSIYVPPECPEGELCSPGKQPHFWITDQPNQEGRKRAMMVVNYSIPIFGDEQIKTWKDEPVVQIEKGKPYLFKGYFRRFSDTGFNDENGLLEFRFYESQNEDGEKMWVAPPAAEWHPKSVEMRAEEARVVEEQMKKAQAKKKKK